MANFWPCKSIQASPEVKRLLGSGNWAETVHAMSPSLRGELVLGPGAHGATYPVDSWA